MESENYEAPDNYTAATTEKANNSFAAVTILIYCQGLFSSRRLQWALPKGNKH